MRTLQTTKTRYIGIGKRLGLGEKRGGQWWYTQDELDQIARQFEQVSKSDVAKASAQAAGTYAHKKHRKTAIKGPFKGKR